MAYTRGAKHRSRLTVRVCVLPLLCLWLALLPFQQTKALFIGNSLLAGANGSGMCATSPDKDYYALVNKALSQKHFRYSASRIYGRAWEDCTSTSAQQQWLDSIAHRLTSDLDYVFIQLGDNVDNPRKLAVFESGMQDFIDRAQELCPQAKIVWVGLWRHTSRKMAIVAEVCAEQQIPWVDISPFRTRQYESRKGVRVTYLDGSSAVVTSEAVALHPNDTGMARIADAILETLASSRPFR